MHQVMLPTKNVKALAAMRWVLDQLEKGVSTKELDHKISAALRPHERGPRTLAEESFSLRSLRMCGHEVPLKERCCE
jgi:hypothetical protein